MLYDICQTSGFILTCEPYQEKKIFVIFSKDFGLLKVIASGLNNQASKNNSHLQEFCLINFDLIFARKNIITEAEVKNNFFYLLDFEERKILKNISNLLIKFLPNNTKVSDIFNDYLELFILLSDKKNNYEILELVFLSRFFNFLAYFPASKIENLLFSDSLRNLNYSEIFKFKKYLSIKINQIISEVS